MSRFTKKSYKPLDKVDKELMDSIEQGQWKLVSNLQAEHQKLKWPLKTL